MLQEHTGSVAILMYRPPGSLGHLFLPEIIHLGERLGSEQHGADFKKLTTKLDCLFYVQSHSKSH